MRPPAPHTEAQHQVQREHPSRSSPLVSVVIVTYYSEDDILECLRSISRCRMPLETIVVDNASQDATVERLRAAEALIDALTCNAHNVGFAKAVNQGIRQAQGEYILVLNPDAVLRPGAIEQAADALGMSPDAGVAGALLLNADGTEQPGGRRFIPTPGRALARVIGLHRLFPGRAWAQGFVLNADPLPATTSEVEATSGAFMLVRRAAIEQVGGLDEGYFMHCEDLDWCVRMRAHGWRVLFVPGARVVHKKGRSSRQRPVRVEWHKHKGMIRFYRKFFLSRYPLLLMPLIVCAVWTRFALKALLLLASASHAMLTDAGRLPHRIGSPKAVRERPAVGRLESRRP
jgi:GT2 family glycosyltransferase